MNWQGTILFVIALLTPICVAIAFVYKVGKRDGVREEATKDAETIEVRASKVPVIEGLLADISSKVAVNHAETRSDIAAIKSDFSELKADVSGVKATLVGLEKRKVSFSNLRVPTGDWTREVEEAEGKK